METQSVSKTERLAKTSRILGILAFGFLLLTFLIGLWIRLSDFDEFKKLALLSWVAYAFLGNLITGIPGCITAIIALRKNREEGNDQKIKRTATIGLILSVLGIAMAVIIFVYALIFGTNTPPPDISTPVPSTASP